MSASAQPALSAVSSGAPLLDVVHHVDCMTLLKALPDGCIDAVITDPPYGVGKVSARRLPSERFSEIVGNQSVNIDWIIQAHRVLKEGGAAYVFANWQNFEVWKSYLTASGLIVRGMIVWDKMQHGLADLETCYAPQHELILFAAKGHHALKGPRPSDVIRYPKVQPSDLLHPYEKPIGLLAQLIKSSTDLGAIVCDPFCGSGATLRAAHNLKRRYIGCDVSAEYVAVSKQRNAILPMPTTVAPGVVQHSLFEVAS